MKFYLATAMGGTVFTNRKCLEIFQRFDCFITGKASDADVIAAHNYKHLLRYVLQYPRKKFLVWTNEPRFDTTFKNEIKLPLGFPGIEIMNVYGKDIFWNNLHFLASYHFDNANDLGINIGKPLLHLTKEKLHKAEKKNKIAALFTNTLNQNTKLIRGNMNIDLYQKRCKYALAGNARKLLDIYGNKWPDKMAVGNSGYGFESDLPWWIEKIKVLSGYRFNLCFENTSFGYYVTEKIWHAITSYCLPVYNGLNSNIYENFPKNSFVDAATFDQEDALFDYIETMSTDEYLEKLNVCIDSYNHALEIKAGSYQTNMNEIIQKIINRLAG